MRSSTLARARPYPKVVRVSNRAEAQRAAQNSGTLVLVVPGSIPKRLEMQCPCGCGELVSVNLMRASGPAWRLQVDRRGRVSVFPSVERRSGCKSHFFIENSLAYLISPRRKV